MHCQREWDDLLGRILKRWEGTFPEPSMVPDIYPFLVSSTSFLCVFNPISQMEKPSPGDQVLDSGSSSTDSLMAIKLKPVYCLQVREQRLGRLGILAMVWSTLTKDSGLGIWSLAISSPLWLCA